MESRHALFALVSVVLLGLSPFATSALAVGVSETGDDVLESDDGSLALAVTQDGTVTVAVTDNGSAVANATVAVTAANASENGSANATYAGEGTHETDANGTVALPAPEENVTVDIAATVDDETVSETVTLHAVEGETESGDSTDEVFGRQVSLFVHDLFTAESVDEDTTLGRLISEFVVANNPGAEHRPEHAGPPEDRGSDEESEERGDERDDDETRRGPPEDRGPEKDARGPPEDRGGDGEGEDDDGEEDERDDDEDDDGEEDADERATTAG